MGLENTFFYIMLILNIVLLLIILFLLLKTKRTEDDITNKEIKGSINLVLKKEKELEKREKEIHKAVEELYAASLSLAGRKMGKGLKNKRQAHAELYNDIKKSLLITDKLLEKLPKEEINKFTKSKDFKKYKKVIEHFKRDK